MFNYQSGQIQFGNEEKTEERDKNIVLGIYYKM